MHILLSTFVKNNENFKCVTKTIMHEKSKKEEKGKNEWLHPDIVGVYYPFYDYSENVLKLFKISETPYKLFSFELKKELIIEICENIIFKQYLIQAGQMKVT